MPSVGLEPGQPAPTMSFASHARHEDCQEGASGVNASTIPPQPNPEREHRDCGAGQADPVALAGSDMSETTRTVVSAPNARLSRLAAALLALLVHALSACSQAPTAALIPAPNPTAASRLSPANPPGASTPSPIPNPDASPTARPTPQWETDAFSETDYPWADPTSVTFPRRASESLVTVANSVFFDDPRFFGFDVQTGSGWYHVIGGDHWTALDGEHVSPRLIHERRPRDGDSVVVYGALFGRFVIASYVGLVDGTAWYYRALLGADELSSGRLPPQYDGLQVWVRGVLDSPAGVGRFYSLPDQASLSPQRLGQDALVGGRLHLKDDARVQVTEGIYVLDRGRYVKILASAPTATDDRYEEGVIVATGRVGGLLTVQKADGSSVQIGFRVSTRLEFADGSPASSAELRPGRRIQALGTSEGGDALAAVRITVVSAIAAGRPYAVFVAGGRGDLWAVELSAVPEAAMRRQVTHLTAPMTGLENAAFSPDGARFVFARPEKAGSVLVLGDLQTGELQELLTNDLWQERDPAWSPEGSRIVFARYRTEGENQIDGGV